MSDQNCGNCRFSFKANQGLICRRYPPNASLIPMPVKGLTGMEMQIQNMAASTPVQSTQWCGEYAMRVELRAVQ